MKEKSKADALKALVIIAVLAVLGVVVYIAMTLAGYVGYPLGDANAFVGVTGAVLALAGGGLIAYPTPKTTGVGIALAVIGGFLLVELMFVLMA